MQKVFLTAAREEPFLSSRVFVAVIAHVPQPEGIDATAPSPYGPPPLGERSPELAWIVLWGEHGA